MNASTSFRRGRIHRLRGSLAVKTVVLAVVALGAILAWLVAVPAARDGAAALLPPRNGVVAADAQVVSCPGSESGKSCRIRLASAGTGETEMDLVRTGLFEISVGMRLPVRVEGRGSGAVATPAGWRPVVDAALLLALTLLLTGQAIRRWQIVLDHAPYYGDEAEADEHDEPGPSASTRGPQAVPQEG